MATEPVTSSDDESFTKTPFIWNDENKYRLAIYAVTLLRRQTRYIRWLMDELVSPGPFEFLASALGTTEEDCEEQWEIIRPQYQYIIDCPQQFSICDISYQGVRLAHLDQVPASFTEYTSIEPVYICRICGYRMHDEDQGVHDSAVCNDQWDIDPEERV